MSSWKLNDPPYTTCSKTDDPNPPAMAHHLTPNTFWPVPNT